MKTKANSQWSQVWKRNAVVAAIALFVCAAVYLNWNYEQEVNAGKTLGESAMVGGRSDPLVGQSASGSQGASPDQSQPAGDGADGQAQSPAAASGYFANARLNRQQARDSALTLLQDAAAGEEADQTMKDQANATIQTMADYTVTEAQIENLVVAKGYADCVAFIGDQSLSLAVAAPENGLTEADTARIVDVVGQVTDFTAGQIKIIPVE
ncbi:MAG: SpoIIIAH-like family protein [Lawsonibacter sp.]|nr:SpoIIIAH-like family protein [Lawsonibacter sp.]